MCVCVCEFVRESEVCVRCAFVRESEVYVCEIEEAANVCGETTERKRTESKFLYDLNT